MKITRGYVGGYPDGAYLYITNFKTNKGTAVSVTKVADIDDAAVRNAPGPRDHKEAAEIPRDITWAPVEVRREVVRK